MSGNGEPESVRLEVELSAEKKPPCSLLHFYGLRVYLSVMLTVLLILAIVILKFSTSPWGRVTSDCLRMVVNTSDTELDDRLLDTVEESIQVRISYLLPNGTWV